jgi:hypothetical protein
MTMTMTTTTTTIRDDEKDEEEGKGKGTPEAQVRPRTLAPSHPLLGVPPDGISDREMRGLQEGA